MLRFAPYDNELRICSEYDIVGQFHIQRILNEAGLRVPKALCYETIREFLPQPGFVMERIDGDVADANAFASGFFHDATDEQRATIVDEILKALGEVHAIDWQGRGLEAHCAKASGRFDTDSGVTIGTPMNGEPCDPGNGTIISFTAKKPETC